MRYKYAIAAPARIGFYKVYNEAGAFFIGFFDQRNMNVGPILPQYSPDGLILPLDETPNCYEWSEWYEEVDDN